MQINARKLLLLVVAVVIALLNGWYMIAPAATSLPPHVLAIINAVAGALVVGLHILQENGLIDSKTVPGLSSLTGDSTEASAKVVNVGDEISEIAGAVKSIEVTVKSQPDVGAVSPTPNATKKDA